MKYKRILSLLIAVALLLSALPAQALPAPVAVRQPPGPGDPAERLMQATGGAAHIALHPATGVASFVRLEAGSLTAMKLTRRTDAAARAQALAFFEAYGDLFGMSAPERELRPVSVSADGYGARHVKYAQVYAGVPVFGASLQAHFNKAGDLTAVNGVFIPNLDLNTTPTLSAGAAEALAIEAVARQQNADRDPIATPELAARDAVLYVYRANLLRGIPGDNLLVYEVEVTGAGVREFVYVDAHTGKVVDQFTGVYDALTRRAFNGEKNYPATPTWVEGDPLPSLDTEEGRVVIGAGEIYNLVASVSGGDFLSYNGADIGMDSIYSATMEGQCANAQWTGIYARFCPGGTGDDTVGHEWGHAYTEGTDNLIYAWQSGALNESYSDIWGEAMDLLDGGGADTPGGRRTDGGCSQYTSAAGEDQSYRWLLGEDDTAFGGAIRDLWNPICYGGPGKTSDGEYYCDEADQGGVHTNSGVPNHAFALLVDGGAYNGQTVTGIGLTKTLALYWRAQSVYQTETSNFQDHADALEAACADLIGQPIYGPSTTISVTAAVPASDRITAADCAEIPKAMAAVEMRTPPGCDFAPLLESPAPALCGDMESVESVFSEDWESGALNGWSAGRRAVLNPDHYVMADWHVAGDLPRGRAGQAAFGQANGLGTCGTGNDQSSVRYLESPDIVLPATGALPKLAFDHTPGTEADYDGGNLKIRVNGGDWALVPPGAFTFNPYPGALTGTGSTNPLAGEPAFHGSDEGDNSTQWGQSQVDLTGLAQPGDTVRLRFELGIDGCGGTVGWYVDEVQLYRCFPAPRGVLTGAVTDADNGQPIAYATVRAVSADRTFTVTAGANGVYSLTVIANVYTVTASAFGYSDGATSGIAVADGGQVVQDFALDPLPAATLSGKVSDAVAGWPLYASLDIAGPGGAATFWTNPETGQYAFKVPVGMTHTLAVKTWVAGYVPVTDVVYLSADAVRDFALDAEPMQCIAPGHTGGGAEILRDGSFEAGPSGPDWQTYSARGWNLIDTRRPRTGLYGAWQGGGNETTALTQTLTIPPGAARLSFWLSIAVEGGADADDWLTVGIDGDTLFTARGSEATAYSTWTQITLDASAYADGAAHALHFNSYNDATAYAHFFVDDVALAAIPPCLPAAGGLVVGNAYDANTGMALDGAAVRNQDGVAATTAATPDPLVNAGFYTLFSPPGARVFTASLTLYGDDVRTPVVVAGDAVRQDFHLTAPAMVVAPTALNATVNTATGGKTTVKSFAITDTGSADLAWTICKANAYDNGPLVNKPGAGAGGADASAVQTALRMGSVGFNHSVAAGQRIADDFTLDACNTIEEITFYAYQTGSTTNSTITGLNYQIWDGPPNDPHSRVIFGDAQTNRLLRTQFAGIYRVIGTATGNTQRPIMANVAAAGITLARGTYWLDWQTDGSLSSGPLAPPITINGQTTTGNALGFANGVWTPVVDVGPQGFPFLFNAGVAISFTWAAPAPLSGTIAPDAGQAVSVTFDATGLTPGRYTDRLFVGGNTPVAPMEVVALTLDVISGTIRGTVSDAITGAPIAGAAVSAEPGDFGTLSNAGGHYTFTDALPAGPFTVTVKAAGYLDDIAYPVALPLDGDVIHDVALTPRPTYSLSLSVVGSGVITPAAGAHSYENGTAVDLSATPSEGWQFDGWSGDLSGAANPAALTMDRNKEVTATFSLAGSNRAPTADAGADQEVAPGAAVTLDGANSADPDGDPLAFNWTQPGGVAVTFTATLSRTTLVAPASGALTFTLTVSDPGGLTDNDTVVVTVATRRLFLPLVLRN